MKQLQIVILLLLLPIISYSQKLGGFTVGSPSGATVEGCDTLNNEPVMIEWAGALTCCYQVVDGVTMKRPCTDIVIGSCQPKQSECYVSKTAYWLVDNTGTSFAENITYQVTYDDGSTAITSQVPTSNWSNQIIYWQNNTFADGGDKCVEEPRCDDIVGGCGGLAPPPQDVLDNADLSSIAWRYLNVSCCYDQKIPVKIEIIAADNSTRIGRKLPLVVFYGEAKQYELCKECGEEGDLFYFNTDSLVQEADYPICLEPCGFDFPTLATPTCVFVNRDACDQNNLDVDGNPRSIIINFADCGEGEVVNAIYELDSGGGLIDYEPILINGEPNIDDCNGGIVEPPTPILVCEEYERTEREICIILEGVQCSAFQVIEYCDDVEIITYEDQDGQIGEPDKEGIYPIPQVIDCNKCYNAAGCFDLRFTTAQSVTLCDGTIVTPQDLVVDGRTNSISDLLATIAQNYGGTYSTPTEYSTPSTLAGCIGTNLHSLEIFGTSACIESYQLLQNGNVIEVPNTSFGKCTAPIQESCPKLISTETKYIQGEGDGQTWTLLSKCEINGTNQCNLSTQFSGIIQVGDVPQDNTNTHPTGINQGQSIGNWNVYTICAETQPVNDGNGHYWISGSPSEYTTFTFTRINQDSECKGCQEIKEVLTELCDGTIVCEYLIKDTETDTLIAYEPLSEVLSVCPTTSKSDCVIPANLQCLKKREFQFVYDNGFTPNSSVNDCGARLNYLIFNQNFVSNGWETGAGLVGIGDVIGSYTGWSQQLQGWRDFGIANDPYGSVHTFDFFGSPTWRAWTVTGCSPDANYGTWTLKRDDGCTYTLYPVLYTETIERIWVSHTQDCDGNLLTTYYDQNADGETYTEAAAPEDVECFVSCDYVFQNVIVDGAKSECTTKEYQLCDADGTEYIRIVTDCPTGRTRETYTIDSYTTADNPDDLVVGPSGQLLNCDTGESFTEPDLVVVISECDKYDICVDGKTKAWQVKTLDSNGNLTTTYEDETGVISEPTNWTIGGCDCEIIDYYVLENTTGTLRNREWDLGPRTSNSMTVAQGTAIRESFDFTATTTIDANWTGGFSVNDTNSSSTVQDAQVIEGYIHLDQSIEVRWTGTSLGYFALELGQCCGDEELLIEGGSGDGSVNPTTSTTIPAGTHFIRMWNIDDYVNSSRNLQYSIDGGANWITDNTPLDVQFSRTKMVQKLNKGWLCKDGNIYDRENNLVDETDPIISCQKIECQKKNDCPEVNPCSGVFFQDEIELGQYDCTVSNTRVDSTFSFVCMDGAKTPNDTVTANFIVEQGCINPTDIDLLSNTNTGTTGWNTNYQSTDCPIYGDFKYCHDYDFTDPSNLFIFNLSSTKGSFWGQYSVYQYNYNPNVNTDRNWLRPYQQGGGGYVTGWNDYAPTEQVEVCIERTGSTITYTANGVTFYTGAAFYMGSVYVNYTPYFHPTNIWGTGRHDMTNAEICETNGGISSRVRRQARNLVELSIEEEFKTFPEFMQYLADGIVTVELERAMKSFKISKKELEEFAKEFQIVDSSSDIIRNLKGSNAISILTENYSKKELAAFAKSKGIATTGNKKTIIIRLLAWAQKNKLISMEHYQREVSLTK